MKLPFVSRGAYEAVERSAIHAAEDAHAARLEARRERDIADARYDDLLAKYHALRATVVPGTNVVTAAAPSETPVGQPVEADELKALIGEVCGTDTRKRGMMLRALAADRAANVSEDRIRSMILAGVSSDGVPA